MKRILKVHGMKCEGCSEAIEKALEKFDEIDVVTANFCLLYTSEELKNEAAKKADELKDEANKKIDEAKDAAENVKDEAVDKAKEIKEDVENAFKNIVK